ncbi:MAG: hypothetical protein AAFQ98_24035, partial [Bacteroidota bacterium]
MARTGTVVQDGIVPVSGSDKPTHYAEYAHGGYRSVETLDDRNAIPLARREWDMEVRVHSDSTAANNAKYILKKGKVDTDPSNNGNWELENIDLVTEETGGGESVYLGKVNGKHTFRSLMAGTNVTLAVESGALKINASGGGAAVEAWRKVGDTANGQPDFRSATVSGDLDFRFTQGFIEFKGGVSYNLSNPTAKGIIN